MLKIKNKMFFLFGLPFFFSTAYAEGNFFSKEQICKAAISVEMLKDVKIIKTVKSGDLPQVRYTRKEDGNSFLYRCKFSGDQVIWSAFFKDTQSWGRWRDGTYDAVLSYEVSDGKLSIHSSLTDSVTFFEKNI
ncbi:hypothetical protein [Xenorhabdus bharatensis]|uniref:hypothetical protein n=1 Tax=Xenorhabdus bharatensis TaxID=3136256 RepID=UPI0030F46EFA